MKPSLLFAIGLLGVSVTTPLLKAAESLHADVSKDTSANLMLEGYSAIGTALYKDDLEAARKAASGMIKHDKNSPMAASCQAIADSKTLDEARKNFKILSDIAIPVARKSGSMHEMHCPMAMGGSGANWLQMSAEEVQNPYMGAKMPHCGKLVE